jgi:hypothetical protein
LISIKDVCSGPIKMRCAELKAMDEGRYWIALFKEGGEGAGIEHELGRDDRLDVARSKYEQIVSMYPTRLVMLCERAIVLARSDQPSPMWRSRRAYEGHCGRERAFKTAAKG